jgi:hypothetical protein
MFHPRRVRIAGEASSGLRPEVGPSRGAEGDFDRPPQEGTRTALVATRASRLEHIPEAEPVVVETDGDIVRLELDDGECMDFDRRELLEAPRGQAA